MQEPSIDEDLLTIMKRYQKAVKEAKKTRLEMLASTRLIAFISLCFMPFYILFSFLGASYSYVEQTLVCLLTLISPKLGKTFIRSGEMNEEK